MLLGPAAAQWGPKQQLGLVQWHTQQPHSFHEHLQQHAQCAWRQHAAGVAISSSRSPISSSSRCMPAAAVRHVAAAPVRRYQQPPQRHPQQLPLQPQQRGREVTARSSSAHALAGGLSGAQVAGIIGAVLGLGTLNRVLYRLALVPLRDYVFFLAQAQNIGYLVIYYALLALRYRQGKVTAAMLATPKPLFILTGCCEAAAQLLMMAGAAHLPGALLPLLMQTSLLWNLVFSALVLGTRPTLLQVAGVLAVLAGVWLATLPAPAAAAAAAGAGGAGGSLVPGGVQPLYLGMCAASFVFPALATIIKERIFKDAAVRLGGGQQLDVLVVNAYCSTAQAAFLLLLLPLTAALRGLSLPQLPSYLAAGTTCLMGGSPACGADCSGAPLLPLLYVLVNVAFNVAAMLLVRSLGAVATGLTMSCLVPITVAAFALLPLPLLPPGPLGPYFGAGTALLMAGLAAFNAGVWAPAAAAALRRRWSGRLRAAEGG